MMSTWAVWTVVLLIFGVSQKNAEDVLPLSMAPNSVDDMYAGCEVQMEKKVKTEFLPNEKTVTQNFSLAWAEAEKNYNKKWKPKRGKKPRTLNKEEIMAIYVYTLDKPQIYSEFNEAVRTQKSNYKSTFKYHAMHFFLTSALKKLSSHKTCLTGFRRVNRYFSQNVLNEQIRFGSFTSSSMGQYPRPDRFGDKSCFEIYTCFGADISLYSKLGESEREVLVPPYEVFKVTKEEKSSEQKKLPCEVVYKVKSTETLSSLNCSLFH